MVLRNFSCAAGATCTLSHRQITVQMSATPQSEAHTRGTLTPFVGSHEQYGGDYGTPWGEQQRQAVNQWIRTAGAFDGVVDFDRATADPTEPDRLYPPYDSGDHLHPGDAGYAAMADAIDLDQLLPASTKGRR